MNREVIWGRVECKDRSAPQPTKNTGVGREMTSKSDLGREPS